MLFFTVPLAIIAASALIWLILFPFIPRMDTEILVGPILFLIAFGLGAFFTTWQYLPNDHIHVLSREGEVFGIKREDPYFMAEWTTWDKLTINTRSRVSFFEVPEQKPGQPVVSPPTLKTQDEIPVVVHAKVEWQPKVDTDEIVEKMFQDVLRHREQSSVGYALWVGHVSKNVREAMEDCGVNLHSSERSLDINEADHPYKQCIMETSARYSEFAKIIDIDITEVDRDREIVIIDDRGA